MKKSYILIYYLILFGYFKSFSQVTFTGTIYHSPHQKVYLATLRGNVDSAEINSLNSHFTLKANISAETYFQIIYSKKGPFVLNQFVALPGEHIEFTYDLSNHFDVLSPTGKNLWVNVTGSPLTIERITSFKKAWAFKRDEEKIQKEIDSIREYNSSDTSEIAIKKGEIRNDEIKSNLVFRNLLDSTRSANNALQMLSFLSHSPVINKSTMDSLTMAVKARFQDVPFIQSINDDSFSEDQGLALHTIVPDILLKDVNGTSVNVKSINHKYLLIDFWASWCIPCREETPNLVKVYSKFKDKGLVIACVSIDSKMEKWKAAIEKDSTQALVQLRDENAINSIYLKEFKIRSIPANFLIDRNGNIVAKNLRGDELEKELEKLLDN